MPPPPSLSVPTPPSTHAGETPRRLLITAGPTHEPIDAVRFIGNRSSGRLGIALADHAANHGWAVTLLLGPTSQTPSDSRVIVRRFRTTAELDALLRAAMPGCDVLVMAAAVADYRPRTTPEILGGKFKRMNQTFTLELEPTPDLLAGVAATKRDDQLVVGFALEPADRLLESAASKLHRKGLDLIVANPLATIDAETIEAVVLGRDGSQRRTPGAMTKADFAPFLLREIESRAACCAPRGPAGASRT